jgi:ADP-ribosylglycohydrolase
MRREWPMSGRAPEGLRERVRGCLLGGALGDALGAGVEFDSLAEIRRRFGATGATGLTPAYQRRGAITDDTQMTLFTVEGLIRACVRNHDRGIWNPTAVVWRAYHRWLATQGVEVCGGLTPLSRLGREARLDGWLIAERRLWAIRSPGNTCLSALASGEMGTLELRLNDSKGCGGVMRAAPAGMLPSSPGDAFRLGVEIAALTHSHPSGFLSAGALALMVHELLQGREMAATVEPALEELARWEGHEEVSRALAAARRLAGAGAPVSAEAVERLGAGWVGEEALAIAAFCALACEGEGPEGARRALLLAVNHSGDSDSTGAIAGNLVGARWGEQALPGEWLADLELRDVVERLADDLVEVLVGSPWGRGPGGLRPEWWQRYPGW